MHVYSREELESGDRSGRNDNDVEVREAIEKKIMTDEERKKRLSHRREYQSVLDERSCLGVTHWAVYRRRTRVTDSDIHG